MTDGQRDWEIQLPEIATAYEVKVPLSGKPATRLAVDMATMTAADREILQDREAAARAESGELEPPREGPDGEGLEPGGRSATRGARDDGDAKPPEKRAARKPGDDKPPVGEGELPADAGAREGALSHAAIRAGAGGARSSWIGSTPTTSTSCR